MLDQQWINYYEKEKYRSKFTRVVKIFEVGTTPVELFLRADDPTLATVYEYNGETSPDIIIKQGFSNLYIEVISGSGDIYYTTNIDTDLTSTPVPTTIDDVMYIKNGTSKEEMINFDYLKIKASASSTRILLVLKQLGGNV